MAAPGNNKCFAELHVPDFDVVESFYQSIGFDTVWRREPDGKKGYLVMQLEGNILCFWAGSSDVWSHSFFSKFPQSTPRGYGVELVLQIANLERYYATNGTSMKVVKPLGSQPWGVKDFRIVDPMGFYLRFTEPMNILDHRFAVE
jgi:hypothetical protein